MRAAVAKFPRLIAAVAIVALAACSSGHGGGSTVIPSGPAASGSSSNGTTTSARSTTLLHASAAFASSTTLVGPATTINNVVVHVVPNLQNASGLATYAQQASDPKSAMYRHFLTPADIGSRYGASAADYATVANYFASYGLKVGGWPQRLALTVAGPRSYMEKAMGTTFSFYRGHDGHMVLAPSGTVEFSKALPIASIADAVVAPAARWRNLVPHSPSQNTLSGYAPQQIATAFDFTSAYNAGITGAGVTIGIIGTGPAMAADLTAYKAEYGVGGSGTITFPYVNANSAANAIGPNPPNYEFGGSPTATPPPVTAPCGNVGDSPYYGPSASPTSSCNPEDFEAQIDTEQASLARDATIAFYLAYVPVECNDPSSSSCAPDPTTGLGYDYQGLAVTDDEIQQIIADNKADIVSGSYGGFEIGDNFGYVPNLDNGYDPSALVPSEMAALAAEGIAVFFSTGDEGAQGQCANFMSLQSLSCVSSPSTDTNVTAVGGLTTPLNNAGVFIGPLTGWGQQTFVQGYGGASGGGVSCYYPAPPWETEPQPNYVGTSLIQASGSATCQTYGTNFVTGAVGGGRVVPDISLEGDPATGVATVANVMFGGQTQSIFGGTSVAAPEMAAMWALVLQACSKEASCDTATGAQPFRLGNAAPLLWDRVYHSQSVYDATIYDVTFGANGVTACYLQSAGCPNPVPSPEAGYTAGAGWDAMTGLGAPFARRLITVITGF